MATIAPQPKLQFFDANGDPLVGGRLYSYIAGTTTPQATYTDESGSTTNTNPVILDSRGEASVWFGTGTYKLTLKTAADVEIWTIDNIGSDVSVADLATGIQTWLGTPTSANLRAAMVDETGTGALVFANAPTLVIPAVDVITEATPGVGVTIDGVLLKDNAITALNVNAPVVNATGTSSSAGVVRLFEDTDNGTNHVELKAPATLAANRSFVLPDADGTVQQFLKTDGSGNLAFASALTRGTLVVATGQLELAFINVPSWAKRITVTVSEMSVTGSVDIKLQLGTGGSYVTTGYVSRTVSMNTTPAVAVANHTTGFSVQAHNNNTFKYDGSYVLSLIDAPTNLWTCSGAITSSSTSNLSMLAGRISLSGAIDRLRLYIDGTQTFDAGSVNILYE